MGEVELVIVGVLGMVAALGLLAQVTSLPYPIVLVIGGAVLGFVPNLPAVELEPDVVLLIFLPPLLYKAAYYSNVGDFRAGIRVLGLSAIGLVIVTACAVAVVAHALVPGMTWAVAFILGAIVSPTDPLSASAVMQRLHAPRRLMSNIEGEGLFNDASAIVLYRVAVAAAVAGTFSWLDVGTKFVVTTVGGVAIGVAVAWVAGNVRKRVRDPQINVTVSLLTGYAAYIPADALGVSGILAAVAAGLYLGLRAPATFSAEVRLSALTVWGVVDFIANAALFVLVGLQLHAIVARLTDHSAGALVLYGLAISGTVLVARLGWFFTTPYVIRTLDRRPSQLTKRFPSSWRLILGWSGMRGATSLAIALALPLETDAGNPLPDRDLVLFLTFAVIAFTVVGQGLSLPILIKRLRLSGDRSDIIEEEHARLAAARVALDRLAELDSQPWVHPDTAERVRTLYEFRVERFAARDHPGPEPTLEDRSLAYQRLIRALIAPQRDLLLQLRRDQQLSTDAMYRILRDLDFEELRLEG